MANVKFKVEALRTLASPYRKGDKDESTFETIYYLLVDMKELPADIPLDVNPREPKMTTNVAKSLQAAVVEPETDFYINNRGIVIAAKTLVFNSADSEVAIDIGNQDDENDKYQYGILDGGHTYTAIMKKRDQIPEDIRRKAPAVHGDNRIKRQRPPSFDQKHGCAFKTAWFNDKR